MKKVPKRDQKSPKKGLKRYRNIFNKFETASKKGDVEGKIVEADKQYDGGYVIGVYGDSFVTVVNEGQENVPVNDIVLLLIK